MAHRRRFEDLAADLDLLLDAGESPERIAERLDLTPEAIGRALHRHGRTEEARPFWAVTQRTKRRAAATAALTLALLLIPAGTAQARVVKLWFPGMYFTSTVEECRYLVNGDVVGTMWLNGIEFGWGCSQR